MKISQQSCARKQAISLAAFTMMEIAISLAVIGIALVAIIGVLPIGMNVQQTNREETIVGPVRQEFAGAQKMARHLQFSVLGVAAQLIESTVNGSPEK